MILSVFYHKHKKGFVVTGLTLFTVIIAYVGSNIVFKAQAVDQGRSPIGYLDQGISNCTVIQGWACDKDQPDTPVGVHIYTDGPAGVGNLRILPDGLGDSTNLQREHGVGAA
ncbi:MAG: hypothetical protein Greene041662_199, partial [Candidatus Peregrinibacteria bacterium Greene0416_62]